VVRPDGTLQSYQPYGTEGLLISDIDLAEATGLLAARYKPALETARWELHSELMDRLPAG
jgi:hypothetical protein